MARCPDCNAKIDASVKACPYCGKEVIPASFLETIPTKTTTWQKIVIIFSIIILIAIAFTFLGAEKREDLASQDVFKAPVSQLVEAAATHSGLGKIFGLPDLSLKADPKNAEISIVFPSGPLSAAQAQNFASYISGMTARTYVDKGYMPRQITVSISSQIPDGRVFTYGKAIYNGDQDFISWQPENW